MKTRTHLFIGIALLIASIAWRFIFPDFLSSFHGINDWGLYLFIVPMVYCFAVASKSKLSSPMLIIFISTGALIPILLPGHLREIMPQKIAMTLLGAVAAWVAARMTEKK